MKRTLRFLVPTLLLLAACGGDDGKTGDDTSGDDGGPNVNSCALATLSIDGGAGMVTGALKGAGADVTAAEMSCADEQAYYPPTGEDIVVSLTGLTAGQKYGVTLTDPDDDLSLYITTACPMGGDVTSCASFSDVGQQGEGEVITFVASGTEAYVVVDYDAEFNDDLVGNFTLKVQTAQCTFDTEADDCSGATPRCAEDFQCHECASVFDCTGAGTPVCGDDLTCVAGPALCVGDDTRDSGAGDDGPSVATTITAPTTTTATVVSDGKICSTDENEYDWFKITVSTAIRVSLDVGAADDLDLYVVGTDGSVVDRSENGTGQDEVILVPAEAASTTYYIAVHSYVDPQGGTPSTTSAPYTLTVAVPECDPNAFLSCTTAAGKPTCSAEGNCVVGPATCTGDDAGDTGGGDDSPAGARLLLATDTTAAVCSDPEAELDWYKFVVAAGGAGETVTLNWATTADLDLYVVDATGKLYGESFYSKPEVVTLTQLPAGTYYVRVVNFPAADANGDPVLVAAATPYTIKGVPSANIGCSATVGAVNSCASSFKTQLFRGSCAAGTGVCSFLPNGGGASGALCDTSDSCGTDLLCSYLPFQSNADRSKCVSSEACESDADCAGGFKCTVGFEFDFFGTPINLNKCEQPCAADLDCGANAGSSTLDANQPWNYNTCNTTTMVCTQDNGV